MVTGDANLELIEPLRYYLTSPHTNIHTISQHIHNTKI